LVCAGNDEIATGVETTRLAMGSLGFDER
jgi:hypothetical protein